MADISTYLNAIQQATLGEEVRGSIHDAIEIINKVGEVVLTTGTAVTGPTSSVTGFYDGSLYLNTTTSELWKCTGTAWVSQGSLKGIKGDDGDNGNRWFRGTAISGKSVAPAQFSLDFDVNVGDNYINTGSTESGAVYHCTQATDSSGNSLWAYDFTMAGSSGGTSDYTDLNGKPQIEGHELASGNNTAESLGLAKTSDIPTVPTTDQTYSATSTNPQSGTAVASAVSDKVNVSDIKTLSQIKTDTLKSTDVASASALRDSMEWVDISADFIANMSTPTIGTLVDVDAKRNGNLIALTLTVKNVSAIASINDVFGCTMAKYKPSQSVVYGVGMRSVLNLFAIAFDNSGTLRVRNFTGTTDPTQNINVYVTYHSNDI